MELLKQENESFEKDLINIKNIEKITIYHVVLKKDQKEYTQGYKRDQYGRVIVSLKKKRKNMYN